MVRTRKLGSINRTEWLSINEDRKSQTVIVHFTIVVIVELAHTLNHELTTSSGARRERAVAKLRWTLMGSVLDLARGGGRGDERMEEEEEDACVGGAMVCWRAS